ncbi:MAG: zf-HC2 domain-containing protein [Clostridia bacterium]|nr:zf-HC2 domain-containing protein [Clostridium sp.]
MENNKDKRECKIVQDLLPSYIENLTTKETKVYIEEHLEKCQSCKQVLERMKQEFNLNITKKDNREVKYIKKFNKKINILKLIISLILVVFIILTARKVIIISSLSKNAENTINTSNYHTVTYSYYLEDYSKTEVFSLGDKKKIITTQRKDNGINKITIFARKNESSSENDKKYIANIYREVKDEKDGKIEKVVNLNQEIEIFVNPQNVTKTENYLQLFVYSILSSVKDTTFNGEECYYISNFKSVNNNLEEGIYVNKSTGLPISSIAYEYKNPDGTRGRVPTSDYIYEFNEVKEEEFVEPNIDEYKVTNR